MAKIKYVGGIQIESLNPELLASWYTDKFGIDMTMQHGGGFYGGFKSDQGAVHLGIIQTQNPFQFDKNISITFRVDDFQAYLEMIRKNGVEPTSQAETSDGHFAFFADPEGNRVGIWG